MVMLALDAEFSKVVAAAIQKAGVTIFTVLCRGYKGEQDWQPQTIPGMVTGFCSPHTLESFPLLCPRNYQYWWLLNTSWGLDWCPGQLCSPIPPTYMMLVSPSRTLQSSFKTRTRISTQDSGLQLWPSDRIFIKKQNKKNLKTISCRVIVSTICHLCSGKKIRSSRLALGLWTAFTTFDSVSKKTWFRAKVAEEWAALAVFQRLRRIHTTAHSHGTPVLDLMAKGSTWYIPGTDIHVDKTLTQQTNLKH